MDELLGDMDLSWQINRLAGNLRAAFPGRAVGPARCPSAAREGLGLAETTDMFQRLGELDQLEQMLSGAPQPGRARRDRPRPCPRAPRQGRRGVAGGAAELSRRLEEAGLVEQREGRLELTPKGLRRIGQRALGGPVQAPVQGPSRRSRDREAGAGHERAEDTKAYELGDPFNLHIERTLRNALRRQVAEDRPLGRGRALGRGRGVQFPVRLAPDDFEIERTEHQTQCATVLLVDLSLVDAAAGQLPRREEGRPRDAGAHLGPVPA